MEGSVRHTPLRILMTTDTVGGVWSYSVELCKALLGFGVQFFLVTTGAPMQPAQKEEAAKLENVRVYETDFLLEWMEDPWQSIDASGAWLLQLEEELQPDIIHLNGYAYGSLSWKAPVIVAAHSDVYSWWLSVNGEHPPATWNEYYRRVSEGLQQADLIICPSETMMKAVRKIYAVTTPGKVIYNGRNAGDFYPAQKELYIFSMGRIWDNAKNIQLLAEAAPYIQYPIRLAGDNSFANNNATAAAANIQYLGKLSQEQVAKELSTASVYVLPAKYEPFGLSALEAALSGCALVLGDIDSLKEIWNDCAVYVDTNDAEALAQTINDLMKDDAMRMRYAQKAMNRAANYSTAALAENYRQVYRQLKIKNEEL